MNAYILNLQQTLFNKYKSNKRTFEKHGSHFCIHVLKPVYMGNIPFAADSIFHIFVTVFRNQTRHDVQADHSHEMISHILTKNEERYEKRVIFCSLFGILWFNSLPTIVLC